MSSMIPSSNANAGISLGIMGRSGSVGPPDKEPPPCATSDSAPPPVRHRVGEVRQQQGLSQRTMAKRLGIDVKLYRSLEDPTRDLTLSQLKSIQAALDVPLVDLLEDSQALSRPVADRARLVKVMKTAAAMREAKSNPRLQRLATMLCEQLVEIMPELAEVSGWPQFGARRGNSALGKALLQPIDMSSLSQND